MERHNNSGRILGLDVGTKRVGIAISDESRILASGLETVHVFYLEQAVCDVASIIEEHCVSEVFVGLPVNTDGALSASANFIQEFTEQLRAQVQVPVHYADERFTTTLAHRQLHALGKQSSRNRAVVDQIAACNILQSILDKL
ncbi:MAG: Holliday junction resolvase RuvX [Candidatus Ancillula trichonymphae]|nr:Holliday junction resolvase RuvX [Candidatus Ancillula trichonymphae]